MNRPIPLIVSPKRLWLLDLRVTHTFSNYIDSWCLETEKVTPCQKADKRCNICANNNVKPKFQGFSLFILYMLVRRTDDVWLKPLADWSSGEV